jgi:hypothetical protein
VTDLAARRIGDRIEIGFNIPAENTDGSTPPVISRVEIYAAVGPPTPVTPQPFAIPAVPLWIPAAPVPAPPTPPPAPAPLLISRFPPVQLFPLDATAANEARRRDPPATTAPAILTRKYLRSQIEVRPPTPTTEEPAVEPPPEPAELRPAPGSRALFSEQVIEEMAAAEATPEASVLRYVVVPIAAGRRQGTPSPVLEFPLTAEVAAPSHLSVAYGETDVALAWTPGAPLQSYRVYSSDLEGRENPSPLNATPLTNPAFGVPVQFDLEQCFTVRSVVIRGPASLESAPSGPVCLTPKDRFPPPAPGGLSGLPTETQVQLLWNPVTAPDLAGYLVLRGKDGGPLEPLMTEPLSEPRYTDANLTPGSRYAYAIVAVDKAGNRSQPSNQIEEVR